MILVKGWGSREERRRNNQISTNQNDVFLSVSPTKKSTQRKVFFFFVMQHYHGKKESITMSKKRARTISFISERYSNSVPQKSRSVGHESRAGSSISCFQPRTSFVSCTLSPFVCFLLSCAWTLWTHFCSIINCTIGVCAWSLVLSIAEIFEELEHSSMG